MVVESFFILTTVYCIPRPGGSDLCPLVLAVLCHVSSVFSPLALFCLLYSVFCILYSSLILSNPDNLACPACPVECPILLYSTGACPVGPEDPTGVESLILEYSTGVVGLYISLG